MNIKDIVIKPTKEFPLLEKYKQRFRITDEHAIAYPYNGVIYTDSYLPDYLIVHETEHLKQQKKYGLDTWIEKYFCDDYFRLKMEVEACQAQLDSISDKNKRQEIKIIAAKELSSELYDSLISFYEAMQCLE